MKNKSLMGTALSFLTVFASLSFVSCQDEDYGFTKNEIRDAVYDRNFIAHFGEIDPNQSWDLSSFAVSDDETALTRAISTTNCGFNHNADFFNNYVSENPEWYYVEPNILDVLEQKLPEGEDNTSLGKPFSFQTNGVFYIIPLFQGQSGLDCDLHMVVGDNDICVWKRSDGIEKQNIGSFDWVTLHNNTHKERGGHTYSTNIDYFADYNEGRYLASTREAKGIRSHPIRCNLPLGTNVKFYLHITQGHLDYASQNGWEYDRIVAYGDNSRWGEANLAFTGTKQWSDQGKMLEIKSNEFLPTNVSQYGSNAMIIACEDAMSGTETNYYYSNATGTGTPNKYEAGSDVTYTGYDGQPHKISNWGGDNDINDLVFLIIAEKLPDPVYAGEIRKRYIIEDMGSVVDWDFNDIVVDVIERHDTKTGEIIGQTAELKHLCGTTPFDIFFGDENNHTSSVFGLRQGVQQDKNVVINDVSADLGQHKINGEWPWNPTTNNIWVKVYPRQIYAGTLDKDQNSYVDRGEINDNFNIDEFIPIKFPRKGEVPRIIAVDTDFEWTAEDVNITKELWQKYHIQVSANSDAGGDVSGAGYYKHNKEVTLTAMPKAQYRFTGWTSNGTSLGTSSTLKFNATEAKSITANFERLDDKIVIYPRDGVSLDNSGNLRVSGYELRNNTALWADISRAFDPENGYNTLTVKGSNNYGIRSNTSGWPTLVSTDAGYYYVENVVLTADQIKKMAENVNEGFVIQKFSGNITEVSLSRTSDYYTVTLNQEGPGELKINDRSAYSIGSYAAGTRVTYTATTQPGYYVVWLDSSKDNYDLGTITETSSDNKITNTRTIENTTTLTAKFVKPKLSVSRENSSDNINISASYTDNGTSIFSNQTSFSGEVDARRQFKVSASSTNGVASDRYRIKWSDSDTDFANERYFTLLNYDFSLKAQRVEYKVKAVVKDENDQVKNDLSMGSVNFREYRESEPWNANPYSDEFWAVAGTKLTLYAKPAPGYKFVKWNNGLTDVTRTLDVNGANDAYVVYKQVQSSEITTLLTTEWGLQDWDFSNFDPKSGSYDQGAFNTFSQKVSEKNRMLIFEFDQIPSGAKFALKLGNGKGWPLKDSNSSIVGNKLYFELDYYDWSNAKDNGFILTPSNLSTKINLKKVSIY